MASIVHSLPPILPRAPVLLILGSMPGQRSIQQARYYAHPRNSFWSIMMRLLNADPNDSYEARIATLKRAGIALWDTLQSCERDGSLDANIKLTSERPNNIKALLEERPSIRAVATNGKKAGLSFQRYILPTLNAKQLKQLRVLPLVSSSPAHARLCLEEKLESWRKQLAYIIDRRQDL